VFFWQASKLAFIELGNFYIRSSLIQKRFNKCRVLNQVSVVNSSYKNGLVRNKDSFSDSIKHVFQQYDRGFSSIVVGLNSPYISYDVFEVRGKFSSDHLTDLLPDSKVLHYKQSQNKVSTLSVQRMFLSKLYTNLETLSDRPVKFISTNYIKSLGMTNGKSVLIVDVGYRCTNISLFEGEFLSFYQTVPLGGESLSLAVAKRYNISILDSIALIKQADLNRRDSREWIEVGSLKLNGEQVTEVISFYLEALINKILQTDAIKYPKLDQTIVCGWFSMLKGSESILQKYLTSLSVQPEEDQLNTHSRLAEYLFD